MEVFATLFILDIQFYFRYFREHFPPKCFTWTHGLSVFATSLLTPKRQSHMAKLSFDGKNKGNCMQATSMGHVSLWSKNPYYLAQNWIILLPATRQKYIFSRQMNILLCKFIISHQKQSRNLDIISFLYETLQLLACKKDQIRNS